MWGEWLRHLEVPDNVFAIRHFYLAVSVHCRSSQKIFKSIQVSNAVKKISFVVIVGTITITATPAVAVTVIAKAVFVVPFK